MVCLPCFVHAAGYFQLIRVTHSTYADLVFVPWTNVIIGGAVGDIWGEFEVEEKYPDFVAWHKRLSERPSVKKAYAPASE